MNPEPLRAILQSWIPLDEPKIAVLLSGGIDSTSVLLAALDVRKRTGGEVIAISFHVRGIDSTDYRQAQANAKSLGVRFEPVVLPNDVDTIGRDVTWLIHERGYRRKADIECAWPVTYALRYAKLIGCTTVLGGAAADGHFALNRKAQIRGKAEPFDATWVDAFRDAYFSRTDPAQTFSLAAYGEEIGVRYRAPYLDRRLRDFLRGRTWAQLNRPFQKMPTRLAFPETEALAGCGRHTNLQLGDSGIATTFEKLVDSETWNPGGYRSVVGVYNTIARTAPDDSSNVLQLPV